MTLVTNLHQIIGILHQFSIHSNHPTTVRFRKPTKKFAPGAPHTAGEQKEVKQGHGVLSTTIPPALHRFSRHRPEASTKGDNALPSGCADVGTTDYN